MAEVMVNDFAEAAEKNALETVNPIPTAKPMNVPVVVGSAVGGTALGMLVMWGVPKIFRAIRGKIKAKKETDKAIESQIKELKADAEEFLDEDAN